MQKKMIALAVAGLVSGAAFAQSNVTVFGIMDVGYAYTWDSQTSSTKSASVIKAGGQDGSRVGFRGTEDLGNGLKANFEMVAGFDADTGQTYGGRLMSEGAWLGLSGSRWGEVKAGYFATFLDDNTGIDVTGRIGIASTGALNSYTGKYNNQVAWYSPNWSGFQVKAGFASNGFAQDVVPVQNTTAVQTATNIRVYEAAATYANGGLKLGAAYSYYDPQDVSKTNPAVKNYDNGYEWNAGIAYDFKVVAVSLLGGQASYGSNNGFAVIGGFNGLDRRDMWALGASIPFGANDKFTLGYAQATNHYSAAGQSDDKGQGWTLGYFHNLSKRTNLYALYGNVGGDNDSYSLSGGYDTSSNTANTGYQQGINIGIRHLF